MEPMRRPERREPRELATVRSLSCDLPGGLWLVIFFVVPLAAWPRCPLRPAT